MQPVPAQFVTGELDHLHRPQGSAYAAGYQVGNGMGTGLYFVTDYKDCSDVTRWCECVCECFIDAVISLCCMIHEH